MSQRQDPRERINILKRLIMNNEVESQDYLIKNLEKMGHTVTQGTLSRDLKKLNASKVRRGERYIYIIPEHPLYKRVSKPQGENQLLRDNDQVSIEFSGNIAVVYTHPGFAGAIASLIDKQQLSSVCGTVAGDDTIIIITRENFDQSFIITELSSCIPNINQQN
jgi:transcriptional regulator of arginine metabolism